MTFGQSLRQAREARGWSRFCLTLKIKERFQLDGMTVCEATIKFLETGKTRQPFGTTRRMLIAVLPELPHITT